MILKINDYVQKLIEIETSMKTLSKVISKV